MRVIFTRHGETKENIAGISMGQGIEGVLNEVGLVQARKLAERLRNEQFEYVYASDLRRAADTAQEIIKFHPEVRLIKTPALRERNLGIYEGGPRERWKQVMKKSRLPFSAFRPESGESYQELQKRVGGFFEQLLREHLNNKLLIVSHTGALTMLFLYLFKRPLELEEYERFKPGNTAITICDIEQDGTYKVNLLNCNKHLTV